MLGANFRHSVVADFRGEFIAVAWARGRVRALGARRNAHIYGWAFQGTQSSACVHTTLSQHRHPPFRRAGRWRSTAVMPHDRLGTLSPTGHTQQTHTHGRHRPHVGGCRSVKGWTTIGKRHEHRRNTHTSQDDNTRWAAPRKKHVGDEAESADGVRLDLFGLLAAPSTTSCCLLLRSRFFLARWLASEQAGRAPFFYADSPK